MLVGASQHGALLGGTLGLACASLRGAFNTGQVAKREVFEGAISNASEALLFGQFSSPPRTLF
jgi:hypothetical protein